MFGKILDFIYIFAYNNRGSVLKIRIKSLATNFHLFRHDLRGDDVIIVSAANGAAGG